MTDYPDATPQPLKPSLKTAPLPAIYLKRPVVGQRKNREVEKEEGANRESKASVPEHGSFMSGTENTSPPITFSPLLAALRVPSLLLPLPPPSWSNHAHRLVRAYCGHAPWSHSRTRAAQETFLSVNLYSTSNTELFIPLFLSLSYKQSPADFVQYLTLLCTVYKLVKYL